MRSPFCSCCSSLHVLLKWQLVSSVYINGNPAQHVAHALTVKHANKSSETGNFENKDRKHVFSGIPNGYYGGQKLDADEAVEGEDSFLKHGVSLPAADQELLKNTAQGVCDLKESPTLWGEVLRGSGLEVLGSYDSLIRPVFAPLLRT